MASRRGGSIPILDLAELERPDGRPRASHVETFDNAFKDALLHHGFAAVTGHGLAPELIERVYEGFECFFARPAADKARSGGITGGQRGYTGLQVEHARDSRHADLKEFFHVGRDLPSEHTLGPQYLPNVWEGCPRGLREAALELYGGLDDCAAKLLDSLARGFGVVPGDRLRSLATEGNSILRAVHYPAASQLGAAPGPALRAAPHEDINLITLLCEATDAGLEILPPALSGRGRAVSADVWIPVEVPAGCLVVDSGDMLSRITNGRVPSVTHRVVTPAGEPDRARFALPFFVHPRPDADLSVLPEFVGEGETPLYAPITAGEFLEERLAEIGLLG